MNTQKGMLGEITAMDAKISALSVVKNKLQDVYVNEYCPYKKGQYLRINDYGDHTVYGKISQINFDIHSTIEGMARIKIQPCKKDGTPIQGRNHVKCSDKTKIL